MITDGITMSAFYLAKVQHESLVRTGLDSSYVSKWDDLLHEQKKALAQSFQTLLDMRVISPISYAGTAALRRAGWDCAKTKQEQDETYHVIYIDGRRYKLVEED